MALLTWAGTSAVDISVAGTKRDDISDVMLTSMVVDNSFLGLLDVGEEFADSVGGCRWVENSLNANVVTMTSTLNDGTTATGTFSTADAAVLELGMILQEDLGVGASGALGEQLQIITKSGQTMTFTRGYGTSTAGAHQGGAANVKYRIIDAPSYPNSTLGPDKTRARVPKTNIMNRFEVNVNLASELIIQSLYGYTPGITDELVFQFEERLIERRRDINQALIYVMQSTAAGATGWPTLAGLVPWYDGTQNSTTTVVTTTESINPVTNTGAIGIINSIVKSIYRVGGYSNVIMGGPNVIEQISNLFAGQIRLDQNDRNRGYYAQYVTPSMGNEHRLINEPALNDNNGSALMWIGDLTRIRIRPFAGSLFTIITGETLNDGDAARGLIKLSAEFRNTGSDTGQSGILHKNLQTL